MAYGVKKVIPSTDFSGFTPESLKKIMRMKDNAAYFYGLFLSVPNIEKHFLMTGDQMACFYHGETMPDPGSIVINLMNTNVDFENSFFMLAGDLWGDLTFLADETIRHKRAADGITGIWESERSRIRIVATALTTKEELISRMDYVHSQVNFFGGKLYITEKSEMCISRRRLMLVDANRPFRTSLFNHYLDKGWLPIGNTLLKAAQEYDPTKTIT